MTRFRTTRTSVRRVSAKTTHSNLQGESCRSPHVPKLTCWSELEVLNVTSLNSKFNVLRSLQARWWTRANAHSSLQCADALSRQQRCRVPDPMRAFRAIETESEEHTHAPATCEQTLDIEPGTQGSFRSHALLRNGPSHAR